VGSIYKRGKTWYIDVRVKGKRVRKRVGTSKKMAELALKDAEVNIFRDKFGATPQEINLDDFFLRVLDHSRAEHRASTTDRYRAVIEHFRSFLKQEPKLVLLSDICVEHIDRYKVFRLGCSESSSLPHSINQTDSRTPSAYTLNFELDVLRLVLNLGVKWGYIKENPVVGISRPKTDKGKSPRFLTESECDRLLNHCPPDLYPVFFTLLCTGMRKAELEHLQWGDVDLRRRKIAIRAKEGWRPKTNEREISISDPLLDMLKEMKKRPTKLSPSDYVFVPRGARISKNRLRRELIKIAEAADIPDLTKLHTLRHTFASHLVMAGVDLPTVQRLMGHSDIKTTMIYAHLAPDHLARSVNKLPFKRQ